MKKADQIVEILKDCGVSPGDPERRTAIATEVAAFAEVSDVELVCSYTQARADSLNQVPKLIVHALRNEDAYKDLLDLAIRWDRKQPQEPGESLREENAERDQTSSDVDRQRQAMHAYNMLFSGRTSPERARRELVPIPTEDHFRTLVQEGATIYANPHPEIATELLMSGQARLLSLYLISHGPRPRPLQLAKNAAKVTALIKRYPQLAVSATVGAAE